MFAAILAWRFMDDNPLSAINSLYVAPIALLAVNFGTRGGVGGAGLAMALTALWAQVVQVGIGLDGYFVRGLTFAAVALVVGWQVKDRHRVQAEADRWFSISDEMCAVANFEGYFTRVNAAWTDCLGYSSDELMGRPYVEFVHPDDLERTPGGGRRARGPRALDRALREPLPRQGRKLALAALEQPLRR